MMYQLRKYITNEEFDYLTLLQYLKDYKQPRDKIKKLLRKGDIIRIKKGIYIFGEKYRESPFSREILANIIYGPSYISMEYALSYYGLIPERTKNITSISLKYSKIFHTPVGTFIYKTIPPYAYPYGITQIKIDKYRFALIADKEKALLDKIYLDRRNYFRSLKTIENYLFYDLRIAEELFFELDQQKLELYIKKYNSAKLKKIFKYFYIKTRN